MYLTCVTILKLWMRRIELLLIINDYNYYTELGIIIDNSKYFASYNGTYEEGWVYIYLVDDNVTISLYGGVMEVKLIKNSQSDTIMRNA